MKKTLLYTIVATILFGAQDMDVFAQEKSKRMEYWNDIPAFVIAQTEETLKQIDQTLQQYPPGDKNVDGIRKMALLSLDGILHDPRNDNALSIGKFMSNRLQRVADYLSVPVRSDSLLVHKLYNHGFVVQSKHLVVAFDLVNTYGTDKKVILSDVDLQRLVTQCDILLVTHEHGDHADRRVAELFLSNNKTVVIPSGLWTDIRNDSLIRMRDGDNEEEELISTASGKNIEVIALPGHQGNVQNNIYHVTFPNGGTVIHTGDQASAKDLQWIENIGETRKTDVLLINCWIPELKELVSGIQPKYIVTGHENELGHSIDHREPFWLSYRRFSTINVPVCFMAIGEHASFFHD